MYFHVSLLEEFFPSSELLYNINLTANPAFCISLQLIVNSTNFPCTLVPLLNTAWKQHLPFLLTYFSPVNVYIFVNKGASLSNARIWWGLQ